MAEAAHREREWARERFGDALERQLAPEEHARFERALREDTALAEEFEAFRQAVDGLRALREAPVAPAPDLLAGVRRRLRERHPGRYRRAKRPWGLGPWMPATVLLVLLVLLGLAYVLLQALLP